MASTVTIASKLPFALLIEVEEPRKVMEPTPLGAIEVTRYFRVGEPITIKGCARKVGEDSDVQFSGGYALTSGVDAEMWTNWLASHQDFPAVKQGLIFATATPNDTVREAKARTNAKVVSGLEPLDPKNMPQEFRARIEAA